MYCAKKQKQLAKKKYVEKHSIADVYFVDNSGENLFLPSKTIFSMKNCFFHHLAKTCQPWQYAHI